MIYSFNKETGKFGKEYASVKEASTTLKIPQTKIQEVLDGTLNDYQGCGFIYKPEEDYDRDTSTISYFMEQKRTFNKLTEGLCTWEQMHDLRNDDVIILKSSLTVGQAIKLLKDGYTAIPF